MDEREEIAILNGQQVAVQEIARQLKRSPATISRKLRRNATHGDPARDRGIWKAPGIPAGMSPGQA